MKYFQNESALGTIEETENPNGCVVMTNGIGMDNSLGLEKTRGAFLDSGFDVVTYDALGFGKNLREKGYNYIANFRNYRKALEDVLDMVREYYENIVLWGFSYGGGHALYSAKKHQDLINKVLLVSPYTNPICFLDGKNPIDILKLSANAVSDLVRKAVLEEPNYIPVVGDGVAVSKDVTPEVEEEISGNGWANKVGARESLNVMLNWSNKKIKQESLTVIPENDTTISPKVMKKHAKAINSKVVEIPGGHFAGLFNDKAINREVEFLKK